MSPTALAALAGSHQAVVIADLWYAGRLTAGDVRLSAGTITLDDDQLVRGRLTATIDDPTGVLFPRRSGVGCGVWGHELHVRAGVVLPAGGVEVVSLGWYRLQTVDADEAWTSTAGGWRSTGVTIDVEGLDRMAAVADAQFLGPEQPPAGSTSLDEIRRLAFGIIPLAAWPASVVDRPVPASVTYTESRLDAIGDLARAVGCQAFADADGALMVRPVVTAADPVLTLDAGVSLIRYRYSLTRDGVYNAVVASGEQTGDQVPVQAVAYDHTPGSPTAWDSPFGRVPARFSSPLITTVSEAEAAARTRLSNLIRGRDRTPNLGHPMHPALEPGDMVRAVTPRGQFSGRVVGMTLPLSGGEAQTRLRVAEAVEVTR